MLARALGQTASLFPAARAGFAWVRRVAHLLGQDGRTGAQVRRRWRALLRRMRAAAARAEARAEGSLAAGLRHFVKVSGSYAPGLFWCYDVPGLPRTNNDLEQLFGSQRYHERRASGRRGASPALVVRGAVRLVAAVAARLGEVSGEQLAPRDRAQWQQLREELQKRREARRQQRRFRQDPKAYLKALEKLALQLPLPA